MQRDGGAASCSAAAVTGDLANRPLSVLLRSALCFRTEICPMTTPPHTIETGIGALPSFRQSEIEIGGLSGDTQTSCTAPVFLSRNEI